jgi:hypothetical protein
MQPPNIYSSHYRFSMFMAEIVCPDLAGSISPMKVQCRRRLRRGLQHAATLLILRAAQLLAPHHGSKAA